MVLDTGQFHPSTSSLLATAGFDRVIRIWRRTGGAENYTVTQVCASQVLWSEYSLKNIHICNQWTKNVEDLQAIMIMIARTRNCHNPSPSPSPKTNSKVQVKSPSHQPHKLFSATRHPIELKIFTNLLSSERTFFCKRCQCKLLRT